MKRLIILLAMVFMTGCSTLGNKTVKFTKYGPGGTEILNVWELSTPGKANVEFDPLTGKIIYTGKTAGVFENLKDLLMLKAIQTDINVSNK